ncbi:MAG: 2-(1,2-epoxy-1,2-dihydrophenyl)acetyl-CoA isomerase PaaG [Acidobacteriota bacterium]|nr:2-(1,2-epoxy-1,2-dihydrophenyl)acetyl-CoA isomerase PaaG [Acidobacteriota bacterium]
MSYHSIQFAVSDGIARLTLNRPDKLNSFTVNMHKEVRDALAEVNAVAGIRVLLLTGAGRGFCAGQDLEDLTVVSDSEPVDLGATIEQYYAPLVLALRALPLPVVCAVNGVAAGAGANLALSCDLVIAKKSASFIQSFAKLGLIPDTGGTYLLPRLVGTARAMGLALLGDKISGEQAAEWGLIWKCYEDDAFDAATEKLVQHLASAPTLALARTKHAIHQSAHRTFAEQLMVERDAMRELGLTNDFREGVNAFLGKRAPVFYGS